MEVWESRTGLSSPLDWGCPGDGVPWGRGVSLSLHGRSLREGLSLLSHWGFLGTGMGSRSDTHLRPFALTLLWGYSGPIWSWWPG